MITMYIFSSWQIYPPTWQIFPPNSWQVYPIPDSLLCSLLTWHLTSLVLCNQTLCSQHTVSAVQGLQLASQYLWSSSSLHLASQYSRSSSSTSSSLNTEWISGGSCQKFEFVFSCKDSLIRTYKILKLLLFSTIYGIKTKNCDHFSIFDYQ